MKLNIAMMSNRWTTRLALVHLGRMIAQREIRYGRARACTIRKHVDNKRRRLFRHHLSVIRSYLFIDASLFSFNSRALKQNIETCEKDVQLRRREQNVILSLAHASVASL